MEKSELKDIREFEGLIKKVYDLEVLLEGAAKWEAYLTSKDRYKDMLFEISQDSERHRGMLEDLILDLETFDLDEIKEDISRREFDYAEMKDQEIMKELLNYEKTALHAYKKLQTIIDDRLVKEYWQGEEDGLTEPIKELISDEKKHVELVRENANIIEWE